MRAERGSAGLLTALFAVVIVLIGFVTFFIGFLIAPLIVMVLAYAVLVVMDRRHHHSGTRPSHEPPASFAGPERSRVTATEPADTED